MNAFTYVLIFLVTAICNGTCQCPFNFYIEDNNCYKYAERFYEEVHSAQACQRLTHAAYLNGRCVCSPGFYYENHHCNNRIPTDYENPVASARACEYLEDAIYAKRKCHKKKQLHGTCSANEQCMVSFSKCSKGECKCKDKYYEHNNRCYAPVDGKCNIPEDCTTIWIDCKSGTCQLAGSPLDGELSTKPGATAVSDLSKYLYSDWYRFKFFTASTSHEAGDPGNLAWVKNYTLDRIVAYNYLDEFTSSCRARNAKGQFVPGIVSFDTHNHSCQVDHFGNKFSTDDYEVYVDLGPEKKL